MGRLVDGIWRDEWYDTASTGGRFQREDAGFRDWVRADGSTPFAPEVGRYHLYVSTACPWAHRTLVFRVLKGLEDVVSVSKVEPLMLENGWTFAPGGDPVNGARFLHEVYTKARPGMTGRVTTPVLWDKATGTIVSNESAEIIRMFNGEFGALASGPDYSPEDLRAEIEAVNAVVYDRVNNGVYKTGFATTQAAYEEAFDALFDALDGLEERLAATRYLCGDRLTEADWRLWTTLIRFDAVYHGHFKCNRNRLVDFPNLWGFTRELYQMPGLKETTDFATIKAHYYGSHRTINPTGLIPKGPALDLMAPHGRDR